MSSSSEALRAYEWGRARVASTRAVFFASIVAAVSAIAIGRGAIPWALASFVALAFAGWRGGALQRGALRGALGGLVALALPMSFLRPCCDAAMTASGSCCTMPSMCGVSGIVLGLAMALVWPREPSRSWARHDHFVAGAGVALGALSVASTRCSGLFIGESIGLALGLLAGVAASTAARALLARVRA